jgi:capsular polysaccharide biosynthesis protein
MICDRLKKTNEIHSINLRTLGSFCDFVEGTSPEDSSYINFLEDNKTYVIMEDRSNYHHFFINLMMPALTALKELDNEDLHFVLCNLNVRPQGQNFDSLLVELLKENGIGYTEISNDDFEYINAKNFIPINGSDIHTGIPLLYNYLVNKYEISPKVPDKKIYISRKNFLSQDARVDNEEALENYFIEKGFQIAYPESITTFKEQFELFYSCSTLASLTGSGLTGLMFMQEGQEVIEMITEVMVGTRPADDGTRIPEYGIHEHYREFSFIKNHKYLSVSNLEKQADLVKASLDDLVFSLDQTS